ncbi:MAG: hypothetical protein FGM28_04835 [Limnohabitans sp.]|jgi:hypothetical protein|nr:hypothetical protein [Limnohabitans sp.]
MQLEKFDLPQLRSHARIETLSKLEVGDCLFFQEHKEAQSMRVLSYYLLKTRQLNWRFTFRKMDKGWRLIRTQ